MPTYFQPLASTSVRNGCSPQPTSSRVPGQAASARGSVAATHSVTRRTVQYSVLLGGSSLRRWGNDERSVPRVSGEELEGRVRRAGGWRACTYYHYQSRSPMKRPFL